MPCSCGDKYMTVAEKPKEDTKVTEEAKKAEPFDDGEMCTVLRRNWGTPGVPIDKVDYLDRYTCVGGVIRNVFYRDAKQWVKLGLIHPSHIFPNHAQADEFSKRMGRNPLAPENLATAVQRLSPDKITAILGEEAALKLAMEVQKLVSSRKKEEEHGTS